MKIIFLVIACLVIISSSQPRTLPQPDQIIELFRHGARAPLSTYDSSWPLNQFGLLTPVGMRQHYILGKVLSEKYPDLIGSTYNFSEVYLLSDSVSRCIQSAGAHLYGMYLGTGPSLPNNYPSELAVPPFQDVEVKNISDSLPNSQALPFNFIPCIINVVDESNGYIFQSDSGNYCPNQPLWENQNANDDSTKKAFEIFVDTINNVNKLLDESHQLTTAQDINAFGDTLIDDLYDNRTLPGGITDPELITNVTWAFTWFTFHLRVGQLQQKQLCAFPIVQTLLDQLAAFRSGQNYNKVTMLSGHDSNIFAVLGAFGILNEDCVLANFYSILANGTLQNPECYFPYFASDIIVEFYNQTDAPYVKFYYNNLLIPLCNGQETCSYDDFVAFAQNATGNNTLSSYFQQCGANSTFLSSIGYTNVTPTEYTPIQTFVFSSKNNYVRMETLAIAGLTLLCIIILVKMAYDKIKYNRELEKIRRDVNIYVLKY